MKRLAWLNDIHLNFLTDAQAEAFADTVRAAAPDAVLIGGDIAEADSIVPRLRWLDRRLDATIHFVLGNHDFYKGSIWQVRSEVMDLCKASDRLTYLPQAGVVALTETTALIGHDGWADGRCGDWRRSDVMMTDYLIIEDLFGVNKDLRLWAIQELASDAAEHFRQVLPAALADHEQAICLTHVPPFPEAAWHDGKPSDDDHLPHYASQVAGNALREIMSDRPDRRLTVLCGHTHGGGQVDILPNLRVLTASADYGRPTVQDVIEAK